MVKQLCNNGNNELWTNTCKFTQFFLFWCVYWKQKWWKPTYNWSTTFFHSVRFVFFKVNFKLYKLTLTLCSLCNLRTARFFWNLPISFTRRKTKGNSSQVMHWYNGDSIFEWCSLWGKEERIICVHNMF